jgi:hypothetical protein
MPSPTDTQIVWMLSAFALLGVAGTISGFIHRRQRHAWPFAKASSAPNSERPAAK